MQFSSILQIRTCKLLEQGNLETLGFWSKRLCSDAARTLIGLYLVLNPCTHGKSSLQCLELSVSRRKDTPLSKTNKLNSNIPFAVGLQVPFVWLIDHKAISELSAICCTLPLHLIRLHTANSFLALSLENCGLFYFILALWRSHVHLSLQKLPYL